MQNEEADLWENRNLDEKTQELGQEKQGLGNSL